MRPIVHLGVLALLLCGCKATKPATQDVTPVEGRPTPKSGARKKPVAGPSLPPPETSDPNDDPPGDDSCGSVLVDGESVPLDCSDEDDGKVAKVAALDVVPRAELQPNADFAGAMPLPEVVDHRQDGTEGPVRSQGRTAACTAFSLAAAVDHALLRRGGTTSPTVSSLHLWSRYHKGNSALALDSNFGRPIARESDWSFDAKLACSWQATSKKSPDCTIHGEHFPKGQPVDAALLAKADATPSAHIQHATRLEHPTAAVLKQILAKGQDIWMGMSTKGGAFRKVSAKHPIIADYDPTKAKGGHRFLLAGYRVQANGTYFLVHNSWGSKWGDGGYAWLHDKTLAALKQAVIIDAVAESGTAHAPKAPLLVPTAQCPSKQAPDSVTRTCADLCPDGSPRFDATCPGTGTCGAGTGEVDIAGTCVAAAPTRRGTASRAGVDYDCHAGGCIYTIARGELGCTAASCVHSCPAPSYVLVHGTLGLYCSE